MTAIDINEVAEYITSRLLDEGIGVKVKDIVKVLDLEDEYIRTKGLINHTNINTNEPRITGIDGHFNILCSIDSVDPDMYGHGCPGIIQKDSFIVRIEADNFDAAEILVSTKLQKIERDIIVIYPDVCALTCYPTQRDRFDIEFDNLSVASIFADSTYLQSLNHD